ncbi:MAG TPA: NUDIX hydrolase [Rhizomicrobium sp.]
MRTETASGVTAKTANGGQYAALPYRVRAGALEILLITTRRTHRWIVPKGWLVDGQQPHDSAAVEALEEAGISGDICAKPLGFYRYQKLRKSGEVVPCKVGVFAMKVTRQRRTWLEKDVRQTRWYSAQDAAALVGEPGLKPLILKFAATFATPVATAH